MPKKYTVEVTSFECGVLMVKIEKDPVLKDVFKQLVDIQMNIREEAGVKAEILPDGMVRLTDRYGIVIVRAPHPWEVFVE